MTLRVTTGNVGTSVCINGESLAMELVLLIISPAMDHVDLSKATNCVVMSASGGLSIVMAAVEKDT